MNDSEIKAVLDQLSSDLSKEVSSSSIDDWNIRYFKHSRNRYELDLQLLRKHLGEGKILEIGSAPFHLTYCLKALDQNILSIDIDPSRFQKFLDQNQLTVERCDIETETLPYEEEYFDLVILNEVFEHLRINPIDTLKKISTKIKPGGIFMLSTPNLYSIENNIKVLLGRGYDSPYEQFNKLNTLGHMGHVREYSKSQVLEFLEATGFDIEEHHYTYYSTKKGIKKLISLVRWLVPAMRSHQIFFCRKR